MTPPISLSTCTVPADRGIRRDPPRPPALRDATYANRFDWDTLFYDVYRSGRHIVLQGPPLRNFRALAEADPAFAALSRRTLVERLKSSEYWLDDRGQDTIVLDGPLGAHRLPVQPDEARRFAGRRVLHTLSRNNDIAWIVDWVRFYVSVHGADGVLLYDNASTAYSTRDLRAALAQAFPDVVCEVVDWPFRYGPQGGMAGAVNGRETPWDSDFCQTGSLQHARFRFLTQARSVLNVDIDELVLSSRGRSIFAATEKTWRGFIKFSGEWISATTPHGVTPRTARHGDFWLRDSLETDSCPPKWCIVPARASRTRHAWSVHNLFGARRNRRISTEFSYRHMRGISQGWKESRWDAVPWDAARFSPDQDLRAAFARAGLLAPLPDPMPASAADAIADPA